MKIFLIGGTVFVGRDLIEAALARVHEVNVFNRGRHDGDGYPDCAGLKLEREVGLLRRWREAQDS